MGIKELTAVQKSVMLARLVDEWEVVDAWSFGDAWMVKDRGTDTKLLTINMMQEGESLYSPQHMGLAWRVLNWASDTAATSRIDPYTASRFIGSIDYLLMDGWRWATAAEIQAAWLDKILELAMGAGLVQD